jgi:2'-5' RNA ligase
MALRVFSALPIPDAIAEDVEALMDHVPGAKWRPRENLHITLAFYGELEEPVIADLDAQLACLPTQRFELRLSGAGHFDQGGTPGSIWLGVEDNPALRELARRCSQATRGAGFAPERRVYRPHLTLAYLGRDVEFVRVQRFEQRLSLWKSEAFTADRFHLYSSRPRKPGRPNIYQVEAEYPL